MELPISDLIRYFLLGIVGVCAGLFYRTCLLGNMILHPFYNVLERWVEEHEAKKAAGIATFWSGFLKFIAFPLGYCMYCSTAWIAIFIYCIDGQDNFVGLITVVGVSHFILMIVSRWLILNHPDLEE